MNENGVRDPDEDSMEAVTVYLDANDDNTLNGGEETTTTDVLGDYAFTNLIAPADYIVRVALRTART